VREERGGARPDRLWLLVLAGGFPAAGVAVYEVLNSAREAEVRWTLVAAIVAVWLWAALAVRHRMRRGLLSASRVLASLRDGDYSARTPVATRGGDFDALFREVNTLGETLLQQRRSATESLLLLESVLDAISAAVVVADDAGCVVLANPAASRLLGVSVDGAVGRTLDELSMAPLLAGPVPRVERRAFPGGTGRWEVRRANFRREGRRHTLLIISDVSRALREEEQLAWQRIVRVLSHEINNSLTPVQSMATSLRRILGRELTGNVRAAEVDEALGVIASRAEGLVRFLSAYARLARLPLPSRRPVDIAELVRRAVALEARLQVRIAQGPPLHATVDAEQVEQLLINLVRNAADAALETGGGVEVSWRNEGAEAVVEIVDEGPGVRDATNLFVPFFSTKPGGSGIGLALARQIAEAHGGEVRLEDRTEHGGCRTIVRLPLDDAAD
jgi:two-component system, NtrC family, nitrogen regulation sensor histidine kinase NtrY